MNFNASSDAIYIAFFFAKFARHSVAGSRLHSDFKFYKWNKDKSKHPKGGDQGDLIEVGCSDSCLIM